MTDRAGPRRSSACSSRCGWAPTFARGRRDARAGHVRSLTISSSLVVAQVRGPDDPAAFRSRIAVRAFGAAEWARVEDDLAAQARFVADLLAGRMPADIEAVFAGAGLTLLPLSLDEVAMDCTCERWPMPCAHLAATCYALAGSFETDPFGVFAWRGRGRDELLMRLRRLRESAAVDAQSEGVPGGFPGGPVSSSSGSGRGFRGQCRGASDGDKTAIGDLDDLDVSGAAGSISAERRADTPVGGPTRCSTSSTRRSSPTRASRDDVLRPAYRALSDPAGSAERISSRSETLKPLGPP